MPNCCTGCGVVMVIAAALIFVAMRDEELEPREPDQRHVGASLERQVAVVKRHACSPVFLAAPGAPKDDG